MRLFKDETIVCQGGHAIAKVTKNYNGPHGDTTVLDFCYKFKLPKPGSFITHEKHNCPECKKPWFRKKYLTKPNDPRPIATLIFLTKERGWIDD